MSGLLKESLLSFDKRHPEQLINGVFKQSYKVNIIIPAIIF